MLLHWWLSLELVLIKIPSVITVLLEFNLFPLVLVIIMLLHCWLGLFSPVETKRLLTSHLVHGADDVAQRQHQRPVLQRVPLLQAQLLPLSFASVLGRPPAEAQATNQAPV